MPASRRIAIVGSAASGKSTLARELGDRLEIPAYHLDAMYWKPGWEPTPASAWDALVHDLHAREEWIIDGGFTGSMGERFARAGIVIFLDLPRRLCLAAAVRRRLLYRFRRPPGMADGCAPHFDVQLLRWIWRFPDESRPAILGALATHAGEKRVFVARSRSDVRRLVRAVVGEYESPRSDRDGDGPSASALERSPA